VTATERITMVVLNEDGSRDKFTLSSWVGIPRKHELMWIGDDPYMIIEVEYAVSEGFFGARSIDAAGVYFELRPGPAWFAPLAPDVVARLRATLPAATR
jgi:hypothetical protein